MRTRRGDWRGSVRRVPDWLAAAKLRQVVMALVVGVAWRLGAA
jgi:hypothetical protein